MRSRNCWIITGLVVASMALGTQAGAQSGACQVGARVTDRQDRSGTVVEAKGADCRVKLDDGSLHYYLAWMLSPAGGEATQTASGSALSPGPYDCWAAGGVAGTLQIIIKNESQYADRNGKPGSYAYDSKTQEIVFESGLGRATTVRVSALERSA